MTQKQKDLLLKDLCARLPYNVCVQIKYKTGEPCYGELTTIDIQWFIDSKIETIKPYLRPMSSMTDEEMQSEPCGTMEYYDATYYVDWLLAHHFDIRGLIEKGLAIEAPEGMYKTE